MFRIRGNIKIPIYLSISLILWIGTFLPTQSFVWAQNPFESNLFEKAYPEINLGPMEHNDVDSVKSKLLKGDTANGFKENDNHLMVSAVGTAPISPNSDLGKSVDRNDHTGEIGTSSSPSTTSWEFPGDIQVSGLSNLQVEPDIASSEINDGNLVASAIDYSSGTARCRLFSSSDSGNTWNSRGNMALPSGTAFQSDPSIATNSKGHFIATCMAWNEDTSGDPTSSAITMQTSTDRGVTWSSPTIVAGSTSDISPIFHDKPWAASDPNVHSPYRDRSYMCWTKFDFSQGITKIIVKRIQSSLGSEKTLQTAGEDPRDIVQGCNVAVGPRGEVAVAWYNTRPTDSSTTGRIMISRSYDGAQTWTTAKTLVTFTKIPPCSVFFYGCFSGLDGDFRVNSWPDITWDRRDNLLVTYTDYSSGNGDIRFTSSSDCSVPSGSCTFFAPIRVNNDGTGRDQFFPSIVASDKITTVDDRGVVHIVAQDKREDSDNLSWRPWSYHCNLSSGCDSSSEWSGTNNQVAISSSLFSNDGLGFFIGDYNGLATGNGFTSSSSRQAHAIWLDNVGSPDLYSDRTTN